MKPKSNLIYVAGPFRGKSHFAVAENVRNAERASLRAWSLATAVPGLAAICPHTNTAHFQDALPDNVWLQGDLSMMYACDIVYLTEDWERSSGAREEVYQANLRGIPFTSDIYEVGRFYGLTTEQVAECLATQVK